MPKAYITFEETNESHLLAMLMWKRKSNRISQDEVAKTIGIGQSTYAKKEQGERPLTVREFLSACNTIGIKPSDLLKEIGI